MTLKDFIKSHPRGYRSRLARDLGIHPMHLNNLIRRIRQPSLGLAVKIEALTGGQVTVKDLRLQ